MHTNATMLELRRIVGAKFNINCFSCCKCKLNEFYECSNPNMGITLRFCSSCYFSIWLDCVGFTEHQPQLNINFVLLPHYNLRALRCISCDTFQKSLTILMNLSTPFIMCPKFCDNCLTSTPMEIIKELPVYYKNREVLRLFTAKHCKNINIDHMLSSAEQDMLAKGRDELRQHLKLPSDIKKIIVEYY